MYNYLVEFLGSAFFIYIVLATGNPLAIGAAYAFVMLLTSRVSQGHINPVVSIVMAASGNMDTKDLVPYCLAQILGGLSALEVYKRFKV